MNLCRYQHQEHSSEQTLALSWTTASLSRTSCTPRTLSRYRRVALFGNFFLQFFFLFFVCEFFLFHSKFFFSVCLFFDSATRTFAFFTVKETLPTNLYFCIPSTLVAILQACYAIYTTHFSIFFLEKISYNHTKTFFLIVCPGYIVYCALLPAAFSLLIGVSHP